MDTRTLHLLEYDRIRDMLCQHTSSALGKELAARMRPVRDAAIVRTRLAETAEARRLLASHSPAPLSGLRDVRDAIRLAEKQGILVPQELLDIAESAACSRRLARYLAGVRTECTKLWVQGHLLGEFPQIEQAIDKAIGPTGDVLDSASVELGRARRRVHALHEEIQRTLQRTITAAGTVEMLQEPLVTQRNGRFCVPVRAECRNAFKGIVHDLSASGQTAFMEPLAVVELGNDLREAERCAEAEVQRVLAALSAAVGHAAERLLISLDAAARLDLIFARAALAEALDATDPVMNTAGVVWLQQARHPLLGATAVPIDIALGEDEHTSLLITGPNTGGKTVTLKTVGLLAMMAQSGLHIPALHGSKLPFFQQVFADIGDEQSIAQSLSTFSGHMKNIIHILADAGPHALVLLDEIGAGTDPAEGAALAKAILLDLHRRGCRTIATTHYGELKAFAQNTTGFLNASVEFDLDSLRPTYRVIAGLPGSSNALAIAQRLGLPKHLVAEARALIGEAPQAMEQVLKQAEGVRRALDRERTGAAQARREAETQAADLKQQREAFEEKRATSLAKARQQAQEVLHRARQEANTLLEELRLAIRETRAHTHVPDTAPLRQHVHEVLTTLDDQVSALPAPPPPPRQMAKPALQEVRAGQSVIVRSLGHRGIALDSGHGDDEVEVQVGIMRVRVSVSDLEAATPAPTRTVQEVVPLTAPANPEIHLLGLRAEEAAEQLGEYLYAALDGGLTSVRIVHGFGTGALRTVVRDVLRHHPVVRSYRQGEPQEGGGGVTVAAIGVQSSTE